MKKFFNIGLVRGLVFQVIGTLAGAGLVSGIRALKGTARLGGGPGDIWVFRRSLGGRRDFWHSRVPLIGTRVLNDWIEWAKGKETPEHHADPPGLNEILWPVVGP